VPELAEITPNEAESENMVESEKHQLASKLIADGKVKEALYLLS